VYDPNDPKGKQQAIHKAFPRPFLDPSWNLPAGKQQAIHKAESFAEYLAKRGGGGAAPAAAAAAAPAAAAAAPAAGGGGGSISAVLQSMQGPDLYWEEKGPLQDPPKEESDFKEYDTFSTFLAACQQHGIDLNQPDITVLAPGNVACEQFSAVSGPLTKEVCTHTTRTQHARALGLTLLLPWGSSLLDVETRGSPPLAHHLELPFPSLPLGLRVPRHQGGRQRRPACLGCPYDSRGLHHHLPAHVPQGLPRQRLLRRQGVAATHELRLQRQGGQRPDPRHQRGHLPGLVRVGGRLRLAGVSRLQAAGRASHRGAASESAFVRAKARPRVCSLDVA